MYVCLHTYIFFFLKNFNLSSHLFAYQNFRKATEIGLGISGSKDRMMGLKCDNAGKEMTEAF